MMKNDVLKLIILISIFVVASLACNAVTGITDQVSGARATVGSVATQVQSGRELVGTARAIATLAGESGLIGTAQAIASEVGNSGLLETAVAFATQEGPGLVETIQSVATEEGPSLVETSQAVATQIAGGFGEAPEDIPVIDPQPENFFASDIAVSYITEFPYAEVVQFYKNEMPANGWEAVDQGWVESESVAVLQYRKINREVSITLSSNPADGKTIVLITIATLE